MSRQSSPLRRLPATLLVLPLKMPRPAIPRRTTAQPHTAPPAPPTRVAEAERTVSLPAAKLRPVFVVPEVALTAADFRVALFVARAETQPVAPGDSAAVLAGSAVVLVDSVVVTPVPDAEGSAAGVVDSVAVAWAEAAVVSAAAASVDAANGTIVVAVRSCPRL